MKIVSLQSVGLGATFSDGAGRGVNIPFTVKVGDPIYDGTDFNVKEITVTEIGFGDMYHGDGLPKQDGTYFVYTSDGHIRVFPADKYIAEWGE
ncbi:hypothetical protein [Leuconostoc gelidum]|uniref:hypothetical protein n=1 Tax=Leuconostoc gelidum TaxID=1244 RepID=UPI001CC6386F|nr:hypothetical protein [Leuconostoc gelidum]MBZ6000934.1 hypothetical protein [Leuconostoc gelidum subsp. gelidum]